ncbi:MAG: hypothetical protein ABSC06_37620 [Rhodopila sp.]|jgi:glycine/serine hydroxymethyltransferase
MTANFDAAKSASFAITLLDWKDHGTFYAAAMVATARALAGSLVELDIPVFTNGKGITASHQFAIEAVKAGRDRHQHDEEQKCEMEPGLKRRDRSGHRQPLLLRHPVPG